MHTNLAYPLTINISAPNPIQQFKETLEGICKMKGHILLVEDIPLIQQANVTMLNKLGYSVDIADTGAKAISMFKKEYDLVFMDIDLPDTNGFEVTKAIRLLENFNRIPIVALTSHGEEIAQSCKDAGMDGMATKPLFINGLVAVLAKYLKKK